MNKPLKRHEALKPLSRDHHQGLLLGWKIKEGLKKNVEDERIRSYNDFFFTTQLRPHFDFEEAEVFPLLGDEHPMIAKAVKEHHRLIKLFKEAASKAIFSAIAEELTAHIRFEERELFQELQEVIAPERLQQLNNKEKEILTPHPDDWEDKYWLD